MDIHRIVTQGEPIPEVVVTEGDEFDLVLELYDDRGEAFTDGLGARVFLIMAEGSYTRWTADVSAVASGIATINFPSDATAEPGDYTCSLAMYDDAGTPDTYLTIGEFRFLVQEAP